MVATTSGGGGSTSANFSQEGKAVPKPTLVRRGTSKDHSPSTRSADSISFKF